MTINIDCDKSKAHKPSSFFWFQCAASLHCPQQKVTVWLTLTCTNMRMVLNDVMFISNLRCTHFNLSARSLTSVCSSPNLCLFVA